MAHEAVLVEVEEPLVLFPGVLIPVVKVGGGIAFFRDDPVIVVKERSLVHQQIAPPGFMLQVANFGDQPPVVAEKRGIGLEVTIHQGRLNEQPPGLHRVYGAEVDLAVGDDGQTEQAHFFQGHHPARFFFPAGFKIVAFAQRPRHLFDPLRLQTGADSGEQAGGLHQLGGHDPFWRLFEQCRAGVDVETGLPGSGKFVTVAFQADLTQEPGQNRLMNLPVAGLLPVDGQPHLLDLAGQLAMNLPPFTGTAVGEAVFLQKFAKPTL